MNQGARILAGRYEIGDLIGRGGMAEVHIGYDTRLGRSIAIKMLRPDLARDPSFQTRFRREAQAAAGLNHPTIVAVYDTGEETVVDESGMSQTVPFIVMEYVEGHTVRDILKGDVAAPIDEAVEIVIGVLTALDYSHHAGLVHRDIKPANVMLTPTGAVKVMDFGIARALADAGQTMTQAQAVVGTAQYLSPEQARGENVDARSDLYSTGCLLFELLTGRPPFIGDSPVSVAYQHVREPAPVPAHFASDVPPALDHVVAKALAKTKEDRYSSAREFLADLRSVMSGQGVMGASAGAAALGAGAAALGASAAAAAMTPEQIEAQPTELMPAVSGTNATAVMPAGVAPGSAAWATTSGPITLTSGDLEEYNDDNDRARKIRQWLILGGSAAGAVLLILLLFMISRNTGETTPDTVTVPVLVGLEEQAAINALTLLELVPEVEYEESEDVDAGKVIRSDPGVDEEVEIGSTVLIVVSKGEEVMEVPSVRGLSQAVAIDRLTDRGFNVTLIDTEHDPAFEEGIATRTDPEEGEVLPTGSDIVLYVSTGLVDLPNLIGMSEDAARSLLADLRLPITVVDIETDDARPGEVLNQSPRAGLVSRGTAVTIEVSVEPRNVTVPNVVGNTENAAKSNLTNAGLGNDVVYQHSATVPAGQVISQNPTAGSSVPQNTIVTLVVSNGPPPPSPDPED